MKIKLGFILFWGILSHIVFAQESQAPFRTTNEGIMIGIGGVNLKNTYLTARTYTGLDLRLMNERMKLGAFSNDRISSQSIFTLDVSSTQNAAKTIHMYAGFVDYSYGFHYRFQPAPGLKLLTGGSLKGMLGANSVGHSGNNSIIMNADLDLNASAMAIYSFQIKNYPLTVRYQMDIPVMGALFAPKYGQSYYELFGLGNGAGAISFSSLHNKQAMRNYFTVDFPVSNYTFRLGYLNSLYYTNIHKIKVHNFANHFMIGFAKEFITFGGKRLKNENIQSSYY